MKGLNNECRFFLVLGIVVILAWSMGLIGSVAVLAGDGDSTPNPTDDVPGVTSQPSDIPDTAVPSDETKVPGFPTTVPTQNDSPTDIPTANPNTATPVVQPSAQVTPDPEPTGNGKPSRKRSPNPTATETALPDTGFADKSNLPWIIVSMPVLIGIAWLAGLARRRNYHGR